MLAIGSWLRSAALWIEHFWLALAFIVLIIPAREFEYYAGAIIAIGACFLVFKECRLRSFSYLIAAVIWISYGQYLSIHNSRGIELPVVVLTAICIWIGQLNSVAVLKLLRPLALLPFPLLVIQLIGFFSGGKELAGLFYDRQLGGLSIAQTAAFIGILMIASMFKFYMFIRKKNFNVSSFLLNLAPILSCFVMAFATFQRIAFLVPLFSFATYLLMWWFSSSNSRTKILVPLLTLCGLAIYSFSAVYLPTIGPLKLGFTYSENVRLDAIHCVASGALYSPIAFLFGHGFESLTDRCHELVGAPNAMLQYKPFFAEDVFNLGHAHNLVAQIIFSVGVPLGVLLAITMTSGYAKIFQSMKRVEISSNYYIFFLTLLFNFCFISSMVEVSFLKVPALAIVYGMVFGSALGIDRSLKNFKTEI